MSQEIVILATTGDEHEAHRISTCLIENKLAACVNILPTVTSVFWWDGAVQKEQESLLIIKSRRDVFERVESVIKANHSYDVPEIIALPIELGSQAYLSWMAQVIPTSSGAE